MDSVGRFNARLSGDGFNLKSDGRPILGADAKRILSVALEVDERAIIIPAHAWTPWFSVFGSKSGFDSLEECFEELTPHIRAIETGLSSDPPMNWRISGLDGVSLVSNSDAHGLRNLGREANVFDFESPSYQALTEAIDGHGNRSFVRTIEFFPEEGKYHADGHRDCGFSCEPEETGRLGGRCPKCGRALTRGVLGRVFELADRPKGEGRAGKNDFRYIVPLEELIAEILGKSKASKGVQTMYRDVIERFGPEFDVLLKVPSDYLGSHNRDLGQVIELMRAGQVVPISGYDGEFGSIRIFSPDKCETAKQSHLGL